MLPGFITSPEKLQNKKKMESCLSVERELDKVLTKFTGLHDHSTNTIEDFISSIENIRRELAEGSYSSKNLTFIFLAKSQNSINVIEKMTTKCKTHTQSLTMFFFRAYVTWDKQQVK